MNTVLVLDFDGVLCDSWIECFNSSLLAYAQIPVRAHEELKVPERSPAYQKAFFTLRPYITSGEEYLLIHEILEKVGLGVSGEEYKSRLRDAGPEKMALLKSRLYETRELLLQHHASWWLNQNPLFPGVAEKLKEWRLHSNVHILSTKKSEYVLAILKHQGVDWPQDRAHYTGTLTKIRFIGERWLSLYDSAVLIDDQVENLPVPAMGSEGSISAALAVWGYLHEDQRRAWKGKSLSLEQMLGLDPKLPLLPVS